MARVLERRSALEASYTVGRFGAERHSTGVTLQERRRIGIVHIEVIDGDTEAIDHLASITGMPMPGPTQSASKDDTRCIWLAPTRWLLVGTDSKTGDEIGRLTTGAPDVAINDVSSSRTVVRVSGPNVRDVLASDCTIDLDADAFPPGRVVSTDLDHVTVIMDCVESDVFDLYIPRGFAVSVWEWLSDVSAEFGGEVLAH